MVDLIGKSLGRYHILEQLGEGGMAIVYKAFDTRLEREVAVKVIRIDNLAPNVLSRVRKRFDREAKALAKLDHANIISIIDYGEEDSIPYLVMVYIQGGTLKERLNKNPIPWEEAAQFLAPIARALDYAHKQGIVHRDIKPANILITKKDQPMLTDFGIARILKSEETLDLTGTGMGVGTPEYMAPEQGLGHKVDHRADIYALGIIFYEMVTGRKPFQADTPMAVVIKQINDPLPRPTLFVPKLPNNVERILLKALAKDPANRYQRMGEIAIALERLILEFKKGRKGVEDKRKKDILQEKKRKIRQEQKEERQKANSQKPPREKIPAIKMVASIFGLLIVIAISWLGFSGALGKLGSEATVLNIQPGTLTLEPASMVTITPNPIVEPTVLLPEQMLEATSLPEVTATAELGIGSEMTSEIDGMVQQYVPEGPFTVGSNEVWRNKQIAEQIIDVEAFWVDQTEITNAMYNLCVTAGTCTPPSDHSSRKHESYYGNPRYDSFPVVYITYDDAQTYCEWAGRHLPSMIEWEKAARGTNGRTYPWGEFSPADNSSSLLNFNYLIGDTSKVGAYPKGASPYGALDMVGNVLEWVIISNPIIQISISEAVATSNQLVNDLEYYRLARGGYFNSALDEVHTTNMRFFSQTDSNYYVGFRCAQSTSEIESNSVLTPTEITPTEVSEDTDLAVGSSWERPADGMTMMYIPKGEFEMGSEDGDPDEKPIHTVYVDAFWIDQTEVTNEMYKKCVDAEECNSPGGADLFSDSKYAKYPVGSLWDDAFTYCKWANNGRLPTEAEWEKAARGGLVEKKFPWGDQDPSCQFGDENGSQYGYCNEGVTSVPVGSFGNNGYGLYDMSGNVKEWVGDWYSNAYYTNSPNNNPQGPNEPSIELNRVIRGGLRSADRGRISIYHSTSGIGFRCARDLTP